MAVSAANSSITALNTPAAITKNAATADTDALAEVFTIIPTKSDGRLIIIIGGTGFDADDNITYSIAAGVSVFAGTALTGTITKNTEKAIQVETGKVLSAAGTILLTLTPAATDRLLTNHAAYVKVIESYI